MQILILMVPAFFQMACGSDDGAGGNSNAIPDGITIQAQDAYRGAANQRHRYSDSVEQIKLLHSRKT